MNNPISEQVLINKERTFHQVDFATPADHKLKIRVKIDKYLDLAREQSLEQSPKA